MEINKSSNLQSKLEKTHFNLVKKTLLFIKYNYEKPIYEKDDPEIFISLIKDFYLTKESAAMLTFQKILEKVKRKRYIEYSKLNSEVLNLVLLPWDIERGYFTTLHLETAEPCIQKSLDEYFQFVEKELAFYLSISIQILDLNELLYKNESKKLIQKIRSLKYCSKFDFWAFRESMNSFEEKDRRSVSLNTKHIYLTVQLILVKYTLESKTEQEAYFFRNLLTDFLFLSKLVT